MGQSTELSINLDGRKKEAEEVVDVTPPHSDHKVQSDASIANADTGNDDDDESGETEGIISVCPEEPEEGDIDEPLPFLGSAKSIDGILGDVASFIGSSKGSARVNTATDIPAKCEEANKDEEANSIMPFDAHVGQGMA